MKKLFSLMLVFVIIVASVPVIAEDFNREEAFAFESYDSFEIIASDETVLMEIDVDVKEALEEKLIAAWENMETEVQLYPDVKIHKNDIVSYFSTILFENPQFYYVVKSFSGTSNSAGYMGQLTKLKYTVANMDEVRATWAEIDKATGEILLNISPNMTDFEKVMTVHDYMDLHYVYDITDTDQTYFILLDRVGVCAAYAEAFQHVMNVIGIECTVVKSDEMGHMWNMVKLDGRWYHADVTWDDPVPDQFSQVCHEYMLLSKKAIEALGHTGFEAPYNAISTIYNDAPWRDEMSAIVTVGGIMYRIEGNNLIDEEGNIIYESLDGGDGNWQSSTTSGVKGVISAGLCEINGILYFNTDTGIYSYDPKTGDIACILEEYGIFGLFSDRGTLLYSSYDFDAGSFIKKGEIRISDIRLGEPYYEDGKAVIRLYNDCDVPMCIISEGEGYKICRVDPKSIGTAKFENGPEQTIYIWKNSLEPVVEAFTVRE